MNYNESKVTNTRILCIMGFSIQSYLSYRSTKVPSTCDITFRNDNSFFCNYVTFSSTQQKKSSRNVLAFCKTKSYFRHYRYNVSRNVFVFLPHKTQVSTPSENQHKTFFCFCFQNIEDYNIDTFVSGKLRHSVFHEHLPDCSFFFTVSHYLKCTVYVCLHSIYNQLKYVLMQYAINEGKHTEIQCPCIIIKVCET